MRRIPITLRNDHEKIIGYMEFDDTISDEQIVTSSFSWAYYTSTKRIMEVALIPGPPAVETTFTGDRRAVLPLCSNCKEKVPYGSFHARGTSEFDVTWVCERKP